MLDKKKKQILENIDICCAPSSCDRAKQIELAKTLIPNWLMDAYNNDFDQNIQTITYVLSAAGDKNLNYYNFKWHVCNCFNTKQFQYLKTNWKNLVKAFLILDDAKNE